MPHDPFPPTHLDLLERPVLGNLATVDFQINTVPEPGTWLLLATGLGVLAMAISGRRSLTQTTTT